VTGEPELDCGGVCALHGNELAIDLHTFPTSLVAVLGRVFRVGLVDVEVLLVYGEDGEAEGYLAVVTDGDAGKNWFSGSYDVHAGGGEVCCVSKRGHALGAVWLVGQDGAARRRAFRRDRPVVRAFWASREMPARELDGFRSQLVDPQHVCGDQGEIHPPGDDDVARRLEGLT
jgi:hypothetical protein